MITTFVFVVIIPGFRPEPMCGAGLNAGRKIFHGLLDASTTATTLVQLRLYGMDRREQR